MMTEIFLVEKETPFPKIYDSQNREAVKYGHDFHGTGNQK
jgi:hypothetical protein